MSHEMIEKFVKELTVDRDFKVNNGGDIIMIRHLPVSRCTVALLRQICVWFKVSGYKNQNKESTLGLLKNLVMREGLKNKMSDDDSTSYFSVSSQEQGSTSLQETNFSVEKTDDRPSFSSGESKDTGNGDDNDKDKVPLREEDKVVSSDDADDHSNFSLTPTATHEDERAPSCSTTTTTTTYSKKRKATSSSATSSTTKDADDNQTKMKKGGSSAIATKRRDKKKTSKGTAPDVVTCINTYFCVINVYMAQKTCSIVMDLGLPQTKANLDSCMSPQSRSRVQSVAQPIP
jgi:hypothetical protein